MKGFLKCSDFQKINDRPSICSGASPADPMNTVIQVESSIAVFAVSCNVSSIFGSFFASESQLSKISTGTQPYLFLKSIAYF
jgi:hypothetical protein